jgi:hypothetical protein
MGSENRAFRDTCVKPSIFQICWRRRLKYGNARSFVGKVQSVPYPTIDENDMKGRVWKGVMNVIIGHGGVGVLF